MATLVETLAHSNIELEERYEKAVSVLDDVENSALKLNAILECETDFLCSIEWQGTDAECYEKILALTEIASELASKIKEAIINSPAG